MSDLIGALQQVQVEISVVCHSLCVTGEPARATGLDGDRSRQRTLVLYSFTSSNYQIYQTSLRDNALYLQAQMI